MAEWSRRESNPRPLECHASPGGASPSSSVRDRAECQACARPWKNVADGRAPSDPHRTRTGPLAVRSAPAPRLRSLAPAPLVAAGERVSDCVDGLQQALHGVGDLLGAGHRYLPFGSGLRYLPRDRPVVAVAARPIAARALASFLVMVLRQLDGTDGSGRLCDLTHLTRTQVDGANFPEMA